MVRRRKVTPGLVGIMNIYSIGRDGFWRLGSKERLRVTICLDLCRHIVCSGIDTTKLHVIFVF
jgi:hypothetical protein